MKVLIIGASARAAAQSALRAGHEVVAADLFADRDLRTIASCFPISDYPAQFAAVRQQFQDLPLIYTGAMENYPSLLDRLSTAGPVFGNPGEIVRQIRDPFELARVFEKRGTRFPETMLVPPCPTCSDGWLLKPRRSAGGTHVAAWTAHGLRPDRDHIFQRRLHGLPCSAAFVVSQSNRRVRLLGATEMLVGRSWGAATKFGYCGSISIELSQARVDEWTLIGQALCDDFALVGVFGVDAIVTDDGLVPIEVNPRYTASMEVIEPSLCEPVLVYHIAACRNEAIGHDLQGAYQACAKLIVYADRSFVVPETFPESPDEGVRLADVPTAGQRIELGQPILTILGSDVESLSATAAWVRELQ